MGDTLAATLSDATATEKDAIATYQGLMKAKTKEVAALTAKVEAKTTQIGDLGVAIVRMKEDLDDTQAALAEDKNFLAVLEKSCATKTAEWEERSKTRADELVALADTIKVLNDDDALELFKKTLPSASASLIQLKTGTSTVRSQALDAIRSAQQVANHGDKPALEFIAFALSGRGSSMGSKGFGKVIKMIDDMVALLHQEQNDDDHKKEYCSLQFDTSDDKKKALERSIAGAESAIATAKETLATLTQEFKALVASDTAAKEVLKFAKNRLNQFYNPKLYK